MLFDVNCRLDMCRRQYANDACNRGTAGNFGLDRLASHPFRAPTIIPSLSMFICFMCFSMFSFCQQNKFSYPFSKINTAKFIFTHFSCVKIVSEKLLFLSRLFTALAIGLRLINPDDLLLFSIQSRFIFTPLCFLRLQIFSDKK